MKYSGILYDDMVDGEGIRNSLFVSGCRNHCHGCFSEVTWDFDYGNEFTDIEANEIITACKRSYINGLTILGGDPFEPENQNALLPFIAKYKAECPNKTLWMYTGYVLDRDLLEGQRTHVDGITYHVLNYVDTLVDGPFILSKRDISLKFRGSTNQRLLSRNDILDIINKKSG